MRSRRRVAPGVPSLCRPHRVVLMAMAAAVFYPPEIGSASPESFELLQEGSTLMAKGSVQAALEKFEAAANADSADAEAPFFQAVALNRLGRCREALVMLEKAGALGNAHPDQSFETGWALVGLGRWAEAAAELEKFDAASPGRGLTQEFLGQAYLGLGQYDKADAAFTEALKRSPNLKGMVELHRELLAKQRSAAPAEVPATPRSWLGDVSDTRLKNLLGVGSGLGTEARPGRPWNLYLTLGAGHNDNALFLGDGIPIPAGSTRKSADFARFTLDGDYTWNHRTGGSTTAGYSFDGNFYRGLSSVNEANHQAFLNYRRALGRSKFTGSLRVSDTFTHVGGEKFRNAVAVRPALTFAHSERTSTELSYGFSSSNYFFPTTPLQDRDGDSHIVTLSHSMRSRNAKLQASFGVYHVVNQAKGDDFDNDSTGVFVALRHPLPWKLTGDLSYSHSWDRYKRLNSLSTPAFSQKRSDDVDSVTLQLSRPLGKSPRCQTDFFVSYTYQQNNSNLAFYKYKQNVVSAGIAAAF